MHSAAANCNPSDSMFSVGAHGNPKQVLDEYSNKRLNAVQLAARIRSTAAWKKKSAKKPCPVIILGCNVATGKESLAQQLADELRADVIGVAGGYIVWNSAMAKDQFCGWYPDVDTDAYYRRLKPRTRK